MKSAAVGNTPVPFNGKISKKFRRDGDPKIRTALEQSKTLSLPAETRFVIWRDMPRHPRP